MLNHIKSKQFAPTSIKQPFVLLAISKITQLIHLILDFALMTVVSITIYADMM